jgi:hypothetical protein
MTKQPSSAGKISENTAEGFNDEWLEARTVHESDVAKLCEQEG